MNDQPRRARLFWWLVFLFFLAAFIFLANNVKLGRPLRQSQPGLYSVVEILDGDTIIVDMNGARETVRFIGVDTPETHKPNTPVQCFGPEAANFTKNLLANQKVRLEADPINTNRDRYGRLLRYIYLADGTLVEEKLISQGYGFAYTYFPSSKSSKFIDLEEAAKANRKGLWSACSVEVQANGIKQTQ